MRSQRITRVAVARLAAIVCWTLLAAACGGGSTTSSGGSGSNAAGQQPVPPAGGNTLPSVASMQPEDNAAAVAISTIVAITFSEPIDQSGIDQQSIQVMDAGVPVAGVVAYDVSTRRLSFTPDAPLATETGYEVVVSSALQDADGNNFPGHGWFFTTGGYRLRQRSCFYLYTTSLEQ